MIILFLSSFNICIRTASHCHDSRLPQIPFEISIQLPLIPLHELSKQRAITGFAIAKQELFVVQNLALNPDVTVRSRGVMEKCSMCVQRIEDGKIEARRTGQPLADGAIQTACQQSCPAQAIVFGDMNNPDSKLRESLEDPRRYGVLEEFNFRPSVSYLRVVRNSEENHDEDGADD